MKVKLTKKIIDEAQYKGSGGHYLWDTAMSAFGVRIYPSGQKAFVVSYWSKGRRRFFTLGMFGKLTLVQAREMARRVFVDVLEGRDPSAERRQATRSPTIEHLADKYIDDHVKLNSKERSVKRARQLWDRVVIPKLGKRRVKDVERVDIANLMKSMADTPSMANKALTHLSSAFNQAEVWGWRPEGTNPCRHVKRFKEESRQRYLSESELKRLGEVLRHHELSATALPQAIAAIRLLIFTGCRSAEILKLRWDEVDFERKTLELSDSKTGRRTVVLNSAALGVLEGLERRDDNPHVIPGGKRGEPLSTLQPLWKKLRVEAEIADVRIHDLRHTHASVGVNSGQQLAVVGKLLGHSKIMTTQRYAHLADDPLRQASEEIGSGLAESLGA